MQNFVSTQYLQIKLVELHQILNMHSSWQDLAWDCYRPFFANLYQSYGPWFMPKFRFHSISWELTDIFFIIFYICIHIDKIYVWIVTYFSHFVPMLWPLIYSKISYLFNNLRTNKQNFTKIYIHCMHSYWQDLHWDCYTSFFAHLYQSYGPWFTP